MGVKFNPFTSKLDIVDSPSGEFSDIELALGTQTAPSLSFTGDPNTGIYSPGADQVALTTGGTGRLFIDASGRVGISSSPTVGETLTVGGTLLVKQTSDTNGYITIQGSNSYVFAANTLIFGTASGERLRITSDGKLGLGSSTPATLFEAKSTTTNLARIRVTGTGTTAGNFRGYEFSNGSIFKGGLLQDESTDLISIFTPVGGQSVNITSAGSVGIGTASPGVPLEVSADSSPQIKLSRPTGVDLRLNAYYASTDLASLTVVTNHPLAFHTNNTERARIDSSGRLLVGTSSARQANFGGAGFAAQVNFVGTTIFTATTMLARDSDDNAGYNLYFGKTRNATPPGAFVNVALDDELGQITFGGANEGIYRPGAQITALVDGEPSTGGDTTDMPGRLVFSTTADGASIPTERMRIGSDGRTTCFSSGQGVTSVVSAAAGTTVQAIVAGHSATAVGTGTTSFRVWSNGNVENTNNSYGPLSSDERLKQDIVDAGSQWDDIKAIRLTKFHYKNDPTGELQLGPIAQELEKVSPGLITRRPASEDEIADPRNGLVDGDEVLSFKASILYMKAVKALQEAMERIETLEAKVAALEGN